MDAFEQVVSEILWMEGYWVRTSVKVDLTKELVGHHAGDGGVAHDQVPCGRGARQHGIRDRDTT